MFGYENKNVGTNGENIAVKFLIDIGYSILDRNYSKKYGEIDIIAKKDGIIHFIEVKTIQKERPVSRENDDYEPEEKIDFYKKKKFARVIEAYLLDKRVSDDTEYQVDAISIVLFKDGSKPVINYIEDIIL